MANTKASCNWKNEHPRVDDGLKTLAMAAGFHDKAFKPHKIVCLTSSDCLQQNVCVHK